MAEIQTRTDCQLDPPRDCYNQPRGPFLPHPPMHWDHFLRWHHTKSQDYRSPSNSQLAPEHSAMLGETMQRKSMIDATWYSLRSDWSNRNISLSCKRRMKCNCQGQQHNSRLLSFFLSFSCSFFFIQPTKMAAIGYLYGISVVLATFTRSEILIYIPVDEH